MLDDIVFARGWSRARTLLFWFVGLGNSVFIQPERVGTWHEWVGWAVLVLAVLDTGAMIWSWTRRMARDES